MLLLFEQDIINLDNLERIKQLELSTHNKHISGCCFFLGEEKKDYFL